jgi:hypothetical protein
MGKNKKELSFASQVNQLQRELSLAKISYELYKNIGVESSGITDKYFNVFNSLFPNLVQAGKCIYKQTLMIQLHKFFDSTDEAIHINELIDQCEKGRNYDTLTNEYNTLLHKHNKKLRNKIYAHTDRYASPEDVFKSINEITFLDLKNILDGLEKIIILLNKQVKDKIIPNIEKIKSDDVRDEQILLFKIIEKSNYDQLDREKQHQKK